MTLAEMFDFSNSGDGSWLSDFGGMSLRTFDEEPEIYELLDLDAEEELDPESGTSADIEIDEITAHSLVE